MEQVATNRELRVLLLEDTPSDAELAERELRKAGIVFTSKRVETRDTFIRALEEFRPDIILSDYKLPDFDGMAANHSAPNCVIQLRQLCGDQLETKKGKNAEIHSLQPIYAVLITE